VSDDCLIVPPPGVGFGFVPLLGPPRKGRVAPPLPFRDLIFLLFFPPSTEEKLPYSLSLLDAVELRMESPVLSPPRSLPPFRAVNSSAVLKSNALAMEFPPTGPMSILTPKLQLVSFPLETNYPPNIYSFFFDRLCAKIFGKRARSLT